MQVMKWSVIALAVAAGSTQMAVASSQSESKGFLEDSTFNIFNRILYHNRDFRSGEPARSAQSYREETGLGIRLLAESGFTQGTVGVGVDAHSLSSIKLDSGRGRHSNGLFDTTDDGRGDDTQTEVGGAIKFRISDTVLKYGNQMTGSPVFSTDDSRILPEVATGTLLTSNEIAGLELTAGRFTAISSQTSTDRDTFGLKEINIIGASYAFTDNFSGAIHHSDAEDNFKKTYANLNYNLPLAEDQALNFDFNGYRTRGDGKELLGEYDSNIWSLAAAYSLGAHTVSVSHQRVSGDTGYRYGDIDGGGTIWLSNSVQYSDFNYKDERSWQAKYAVDMATYGIPGLSFMTRYTVGDNIDIVGVDSSAEERELDFEAKYVIQEGAAKDLSFRIRNAFYRADNSLDNDINDFRLIVEYPLSVL
ncbi:OprD family porin [Pseudomonas sp.]|uniref:OprD family porin n=1 Tax=Pseudomonas sp. TaxID=306 RepID=UPI00299E2D4B|nr:OprD family porin [Pseudomonas sp.]MDX1369167.1 OprD family porin [Pseudomonas sp.]